MPTVNITGREVTLDDDGFMTDPAQWTEEIGTFLAHQIGIDPLTEEHWKVVRFLRTDFAQQGETATLRRVSTVAGIGTKDLYTLFPGKPARKMAYVSGLPKPKGCV